MRITKEMLETINLMSDEEFAGSMMGGVIGGALSKNPRLPITLEDLMKIGGGFYLSEDERRRIKIIRNLLIEFFEA